MKKSSLKFLIIFLLTIFALTLVSCGKSELNSPSGLVLNVETQTLNWNMVKSAKYYTVQISGREQDITTKSTSVSLEDLDPGVYEIKIKANGDGEIYDDSDWTVYSFTREAESGLKYQLINNDTEYELVGGGKASGDVVMEDTYRGKPVTSVAEKALYGNSKITSITVGNNVKSIGNKAFAKCSNLTSVTIPNGVLSIGEYAFQSCKALTSITLPDSVTAISANTFSWCSALTNVTLGQYVTDIYDYAFANCESLVSITYTDADNGDFEACLPDSLKHIGPYAFTDCFALSDLNFGAGVENIATYAFMNCKALTKIDLGKSLLNIEAYAFAYCESLASVSIPDSTETLAEGLFFGCKALDDVSLGNGLKSIGFYVFNGTAIMDRAEDMLRIDGWLLQLLDTSAEKLTLSGDVYGIASYAMLGCTSMAQADLKGVKYVGYAAFYKCSSLYRVSFDDSLVALGDYAFYECPYLDNVNLGNNVTSIGNYAFYNCERLAEMTIPKSVTSVGTYAFRNTLAYKNVSKSSAKGVVYMGDWAVDYIASQSPLTTVMMAEGTRGIANYTFSSQSILLVALSDTVEYIGRGAFYNCSTYLINLPGSLKSIGDYAFYGCGMTDFGGANYGLVIPSGTEYIGRSAFYNCTNVLSITIPGSVKTIGAFAFYGCKNVGLTVDFQQETGETDEDGNKITETVTVTGFVSLGEGIESIGDRAFQGCESLVSIDIPNSVTHLGIRVFHKCSSLKSVTLGSGITKIDDYLFYKCTALETVTVSDELKSIGNYAFRGCVSLKEFDLKNVEEIGRYSFYGCSALTELTLPDTLTSIGDYSFRGCTGITSFVIPDSVTYIGKHVFYGLQNTTLYCESDSIMPYWNSLFNSSFRPVFWNCTLSDDSTYVVSFTTGEDTLVNSKAINGISDPYRNGYVFAGWATEQGSTTVAYTSENVSEAEDGTVLYAIWIPQPNDDNQIGA